MEDIYIYILVIELIRFFFQGFDPLPHEVKVIYVGNMEI